MDRLERYVPYLEINHFFDSAQRDDSTKLVYSLFELYQRENKSDFITEFLQCLACCFMTIEKLSPAEKAIDFAAKYVLYHLQQTQSEDDEGDVFIYAIFEFLFTNHGRDQQAIRFRVCEFINRVLDGLGPNASIEDDIFVTISKCMRMRLQDKHPMVRAQAVMALHRLQEPRDPNCVIIKAFIYHLEHDPSFEVRRRVVRCIALMQKTIPVVLGRTYDVKDLVRKEVYKVFSKHKIQRFSIRQRQEILLRGLFDQDSSVKNYVEKHMLMAWFHQTKDNFLDLLKHLDAETLPEKTAKSVLYTLFKIYSPPDLQKIALGYMRNENNVLSVEKLSPELTTFWLTLIYYLKSLDIQDDLEIQPPLTPFTKFIRDFCITLKPGENQFVLLQLLDIACTYSISDENGREQLRRLCVELLTSDKVESCVVPKLAKVMRIVVPDVSQRMIEMAQAISDIREPLVPSQIDQDQSFDEQFDKSQQISLDDEDRVIRCDPTTLIKCLTVVIEFLQADDIAKVDPTLLSLKKSFIEDCIKSEDAQVVSMSVKALSLLCLRSYSMTKENYILFCLQLQEDSICVAAASAIFDLLLVHGFEPFTFNLSEGSEIPPLCVKDSKRFKIWFARFGRDTTLSSPAMQHLVNELSSLLSSKSNEVSTLVCQGFAKLLLAGIVKSPLILSKLILTWFSPTSAGKPEMRQSLGLFFPMFAQKCPWAGDVILGAFLPTIEYLPTLDYMDPLTEEDPQSIANMMVTLTNKQVIKSNHPQGCTYHFKLGEIILNELLQTTECTAVYTKTLGQLSLETCDAPFTKSILKILKGVQKKILKMSGGKKYLKSMEGFSKKIEELAASDMADEGSVVGSEFSVATSAQGKDKRMNCNEKRPADVTMEVESSLCDSD